MQRSVPLAMRVHESIYQVGSWVEDLSLADNRIGQHSSFRLRIWPPAKHALPEQCPSSAYARGKNALDKSVEAAYYTIDQDPSRISGDDKYNCGTIDSGIELANTVVAIVKEVGEMLSGIPYVKSLSGVVLQIIQIRDEIKINAKRCREIIDKVLRMAMSIYEKLGEVAQFNQREKLARLEGHFSEHERTLTAVYSALVKYQSRSAFSRFINRGLDELNEYDRRLDQLNTKLILDIIFHLTMEQVSSGPICPSTQLQETTGVLDHVLPPAPYLMVERNTQIEHAIEILLRPGPTRIAILGGGGFGKTTLARTILHHPDIVKRFEGRYFLSCEGMSDAETLLLGLGSTLNLKVTPAAILSSMRRMLQTSTNLLCLDNFESPWEPFETRSRVEELLEIIADIPNLSLMITIRGEQRPSKISWSKPFLLPLSTLSLNGAKVVVETITGSSYIDDFTIQLLQAIDGIPLGIVLVATLLRDGESSESLWRRWSSEFTHIIQVGDDRQSNLDRSIALSINNSRLTRIADARYLLAALSLLPDGFPTEDSLQSIQNDLGISNIHSALQSLRTVGLIHENQTIYSPRIQMLSPIRLFCHRFLASEITQALPKTVNIYVHLLLNLKDDLANPDYYERIVPEVRNAHSILQRTFSANAQEHSLSDLIKAVEYLTEWSIYIGYYAKDTLQIALTKTTHIPILRARCLFAIADLYQWEADYKQAVESLRQAAELFHQEKKLIREATTLQYLGNALYSMQQLEDAENAFQKSLYIYAKKHSSLGQANIRYSLGTIYLDRNEYRNAEDSLMTALDIYIQVFDLLGQANTTRDLSWLHILRGNLTKAEKYANQALHASRKATYAIGEGSALRLLGQIYRKTDRMVDAYQYLRQALSIFERQDDLPSQLELATDLGRVYIQMDQLRAAELLLTGYSTVDLDVIERAKLLTALGWLYICGDCLSKAEHHLRGAQQLFENCRTGFGRANVLTLLAMVSLKSHRLDEAERLARSVQDLGIYEHAETRRLWVLGEIYIMKKQFSKAEASLNSAMVAAKDDRCTYQQGNIIRSLGVLHIKRGRPGRAIRAFKRALTLHRIAIWVLEQVSDLKCLGEVYEMMGQLNDAEAIFGEAEELMNSVRNVRQLSK
ncbi:TPR-like protein [Pholiota conissans]|uniref:TPR-like protein n=1 Tax=Pholiota conissans TaxID=109636 RepID=A0A9P5YY64_9AGAR|nr:TPR-like protein [Pholiota conissans]